MSKKKNTLKDLDEFLKQQAATLVSPARLSEKTESPQREAIASPPVVEKQETTTPAHTGANQTISTQSILKDLNQLALVNGSSLSEEFCSLYLAAMESRLEFSPEEKMLINTALYVQHGSNWKEAIRQFWKSKKS